MSKAAGGRIDPQRRRFAAAVIGTALAGSGSRVRAAAEVPESGPAHASLAPFDTLMRAFMRDHDVPGAQIAVTRAGRLVYARAFGWADAARRRPVTLASLFRIASVSKPVTATAVMQLVERSRVRLDDRVVKVLGIAETADPRWARITIAHLLQHRGGWDRELAFDPMFQTKRLSAAVKVPVAQLQPRHVVEWMRTQPLQFDPGARFAYSNFGYCLLGRVIESVAGETYEQHVQRDVLAPLGIRRMRLGRGDDARAVDEVDYDTRRDHTGQRRVAAADDAPFNASGGGRIELMDAHGGWLATSVDLVRFAGLFDGGAARRLLSAAAIKSMFGRPDGAAGAAPDGRPRATYYGFGWRVRELGRSNRMNVWHTGSLDGTSALLVRKFDGTCWAVLFNGRTAPGGQRFCDLIDPLLHQAAAEVRTWPDIDRFRELT